MSYHLKRALYLVSLSLTYLLLFYFLIQQKLNVDFSAFYGAALAYLHDANPYQDLSSAFLVHPTTLAVNLNPPFFLLLFSPLTYLSYTTASLIWGISEPPSIYRTPCLMGIIQVTRSYDIVPLLV